MKRLWNQCGRYRESLCLLASGLLPEAERAETQGHLDACAGCREYFDEIKAVTAPLAKWEGNLAQAEPTQAMRARWARAIKAAGEPEPVRSLSSKLSPQILWRELVFPYRRAWTGMAALWLAMLWINLAPSEHRPLNEQARAKPESGTWQVLVEERRLLAELILPATSEPAEPPRRNNPKPRSQRQEIWQAC